MDAPDAIITQAYQQTCGCIDSFPTDPLNALLHAYAGRDLTMDFLDSNLDKTEIDCSSGCSACCYQMVLCSPFEVLNIANEIRQSRSEVELVQLDGRLKSLSELPLTAEARYGRHAPCPLLESQRCRIYNIRPLPCRAQYANSRQQCEACLDDGEGDVAFLADPKATSTYLSLGIDAAIKNRLKFNIEMVELSGALRTALLDFDNVAADWLSGGNPFVESQVQPSDLSMSQIVEVLTNRLQLK